MKKQIDPRMHTAEHILNQTMVRMFNCGRAFSAHIEKKKSKCDYHFTRDLTDEETAEIERRVNEVIGADLPVTEGFLPRKAAEERFDLARLPEGSGDAIRIVYTGEYDACPCIGPHVETTGPIGRFRLLSTRFADGVLRLRFKLDRPEMQG